MISKEEVKRIFEVNLRPVLAGLHEERKKVKRKLFLVMGTSLVFMLYVANVYTTDPLNYFTLYAIVLGIEYNLITRTFVEKFKKEVISEIFKGLLPGSRYVPHEGIPETSFRDSHLCKHEFNSYKGEDLVRGELNGMSLKFSELDVKKITKGTKGKRNTVTIFRGLFFAFDLKMECKHNTLVLNDVAESMFGKEVGRFFQKHDTHEGYELVQLEGPDFEKLFAVYSNDQIASRVFLKPKILDNLVSIRRRYGHAINLSIRGQMLYVSLPSSKNHFEPKLFGDVINMHDIREIYELISFVSTLQEKLELDIAS